MRINCIFRLALSFLLVGLTGCFGSAIDTRATISPQQVISGETIGVNPTSDNNSCKIRLIGIDAPALQQQPWAAQAKQRLEELINNQSIVLETDVEKQYSYNNECYQLAYLWVNNKLLNEELVKEGLVLSAPRLPNNKYQKRLENAQEYARIMGLGIWHPDNPMRETPREFRQKNKDNNTKLNNI